MKYNGFDVNVEISLFIAQANLYFEIVPRLPFWNEPYSFSNYQDEFWKVLNEQSILEQEFIPSNNKYKEFSVINIYTFQKFNDESIENNLSNYKIFFSLIHKITEERLKLSLTSNSIVSLFNFPEVVRISCEQYLLYFAQFLQDLGIIATSNLKEEAGKVLFSVTPTDDVEALDKIREALAIYLSLSSNPIPNSTGDRTVDMVLSGARANAKYLESQLELAIAKLQFKEATLELKDATIEQNQLALRQRDDTIKDLKEMLARGNIFEESLEKVVINGEVLEETSLYRFSREDDIEVEAKPILEEQSEEARIGLVKFHEVTKLKDYGVSLDLPKAIRGLIDYFKRDKDSR